MQYPASETGMSGAEGGGQPPILRLWPFVRLLMLIALAHGLALMLALQAAGLLMLLLNSVADLP